jgi:hypothetical protein
VAGGHQLGRLDDLGTMTAGHELLHFDDLHRLLLSEGQEVLWSLNPSGLLSRASTGNTPVV